jgi:hypothetical protein
MKQDLTASDEEGNFVNELGKGRVREQFQIGTI